MSDEATTTTLRAGRYAIIGELGAGSQAETLDAVDKRDGRAVAIKRFHVRGAKSWKDVELAEREARVLATLLHPNLPVYVEHFEEQGSLYLVMQKIEGETLAALRRRQVTLSSSDVARFLADADDALRYLHSRAPALIHRDIKPGNVIRRPDGSFAFVDFGSVRDQLKPEGGSTVVGTFGYMAPEQFQGRALPASDVYAVGATALSLLTGREPEDLPHRGLGIDVTAALGRGAEPWLVRTLSAMLEPDPDKRAGRVPRREQDRVTATPLPQPTRSKAREVRREEKRERRARRRARRGRGRPLVPLVSLILFLVLSAARLGVLLMFRVLLPTLLFVLGAVFGSPARRAAWRCRDFGVELEEALLVLRAQLLGREVVTARRAESRASQPAEGPAPVPRKRVPGPTQRVPDSAEDPDELEDEPRSRRHVR